MRTQTGMSALITGALLGSGVAALAMLPRIRKTGLRQSAHAVSVMPPRPQWDEPVGRQDQPDWDRNPTSV